jgi:hypothetical protein
LVELLFSFIVVFILVKLVVLFVLFVEQLFGRRRFGWRRGRERIVVAESLVSQ